MCVLFSALLLFSTNVSALQSSSSYYAFADTADESDLDIGLTQSELSKFDSGFYDFVLEQIDTNEPLIQGDPTADNLYHNVVMFVNKTSPSYGTSSLQITQENKDSLAALLADDYGAKNIHKGESLSFVISDMPIHEIPKIAKHSSVIFIGDGEKEIPITTLSNSAPAFTPVDDFYQNEKYIISLHREMPDLPPHTGDGVNIGILDPCNSKSLICIDKGIQQ